MSSNNNDNYDGKNDYKIREGNLMLMTQITWKINGIPFNHADVFMKCNVNKCSHGECGHIVCHVHLSGDGYLSINRSPEPSCPLTFKWNICYHSAQIRSLKCLYQYNTTRTARLQQ